MRIALAQTKPKTGDLEGNVNQIMEDIRRAREENADVVLFPETAITGYCCGALYEQKDFIEYNRRYLEEIIAKEVPDDMVALVGFVDRIDDAKNGMMKITNAVAAIQGGRIIGTYDKQLLANGDHHEDRKYFTPGTGTKVFEVTIKGENYRLGTPICEDAWNVDHTRDIVQEMKDQGADIILSPNQSYFYFGKGAIRHNLFMKHAKEKGLPVASTNAVGVGDIVKNIMIYEGGSFAYDAEGNLAAKAERFSPDFQVIDIPLKGKVTEPIEPKFEGKYEEIYNALKFEQKELFEVIGIQNAQVHISGGIDSAVVAAITVDAMGKDRTVFITNPTEDNSDLTKGYAQYIADQLGVKLHWNPTQGPYEELVKVHTESFGEEPTLTGKACMQAVLRTVQGIGAYHTFRSGIVACGNHTEIVEGWATFHDIGSIGVHQLIGDLTKLEVFDLAAYINKRAGREVIPKPLYDGTVKPMAELADAAEDPLDYYVRSGIDAEMIRNKKSMYDLLDEYHERRLNPEYFPPDPKGTTIYERVTEQEFAQNLGQAFHNAKRSVFKSAQAAPIVIISPRSRGFSNRETIINGYVGHYDLKRDFDEKIMKKTMEGI